MAADAPDPSSRTLLTTGLRAFAARRSLLLRDLAAQVRAEERPWIAAVAGRFTRRSTRSASLAGDLLEGTLYGRYYGLRRHE